jgi:hypothetical protein
MAAYGETGQTRRPSQSAERENLQLIFGSTAQLTAPIRRPPAASHQRTGPRPRIGLAARSNDLPLPTPRAISGRSERDRRLCEHGPANLVIQFIMRWPLECQTRPNNSGLPQRGLRLEGCAVPAGTARCCSETPSATRSGGTIVGGTPPNCAPLLSKFQDIRSNAETMLRTSCPVAPVSRARILFPSPAIYV